MEVYRAIHGRSSVRSYQDRDVSEEIVTRLLEAACQAPSAGNLQPWRFWVIRDGKLKEDLVAAARAQRFVGTAPIVLAVGADTEIARRYYGERGENLYCLQDTAAAIENILLAAVAEGLGACWVGAFDDKAAAKALRMPPAVRAVALIPLGYPEQRGSKPERQDPMELTVFR